MADRSKGAAVLYADHPTAYQRAWILGTVAVALLTTATSLLVALDRAGGVVWRRYTVATLPIASGLIISLLSQFHVQDSWRLRELGRMQALAYAAEIHDLPSESVPVKMREVLAPYRLVYYGLEKEQATTFFSALFTDVNQKSEEPR